MDHDAVYSILHRALSYYSISIVLHKKYAEKIIFLQ